MNVKKLVSSSGGKYRRFSSIDIIDILIKNINNIDTMFSIPVTRSALVKQKKRQKKAGKATRSTKVKQKKERVWESLPDVKTLLLIQSEEKGLLEDV